jgi:hypothetical protein
MKPFHSVNLACCHERGLLEWREEESSSCFLAACTTFIDDAPAITSFMDGGALSTEQPVHVKLYHLSTDGDAFDVQYLLLPPVLV